MIAGFAPLAQEANAGALYPTIVVTAAPLQPITDAILEGAGRSTLLTQADQDAHTAVLAPSQAKALQEAEIIIVADRAMNTVIAGYVAEATQRGATIIAWSELRGAKPLPYITKQPWLGDDAPEDTVVATDPHLWLDPERVAALAMPLAEALAARMPASRATLLTNANTLSQHLRQEVSPAIRDLLRASSRRLPESSRAQLPYISDHQAYRYFLARYGLPNPGAIYIRPEDYLGARSTYTMLKRAGALRINCVIAEQETPGLHRIAEESSARLVLHSAERLPDASEVPAVPWVHNGYDRLLYRTAKVFAGCL